MKESSITARKVDFFGMKLGRRHSWAVPTMLHAENVCSVCRPRLGVVWDKQPGKICMADVGCIICRSFFFFFFPRESRSYLFSLLYKINLAWTLMPLGKGQ